MTTKNYEDLWPFWLDDACYRVARGARYLDIPSEVSEKVWTEQIEPETKHIQAEHGVLIRAVIFDGVAEIQVAKEQFVFDLMDHVIGLDEHALIGVLLGYDAQKIQDYCDELVGAKK